MLAILDQHGAICPKCRSPYRLSVTFTGTCNLVSDGTEDDGDHEYDGEAACNCAACSWVGKFGEATEAFEDLPDCDGVSLVGDRKVRISKEAVAVFNERWPGSSLRSSRAYWFEFDEDRDLIDSDVPEQDDGPAASALAEDCAAWLFYSTAPEWLAENAPTKKRKTTAKATSPTRRNARRKKASRAN